MRKMGQLLGGVALLLLGTAVVLGFYDAADWVGERLEALLHHLLR